MDYSGSIAAYQQELARSHDMTARRVRVLQALALTPGEHVLEVGCGGGMLLRELGIAVGATGMAHGIDLSGDQVAAARETRTSGATSSCPSSRSSRPLFGSPACDHRRAEESCAISPQERHPTSRAWAQRS